MLLFTEKDSLVSRLRGPGRVEEAIAPGVDTIP